MKNSLKTAPKINKICRNLFNKYDTAAMSAFILEPSAKRADLMHELHGQIQPGPQRIQLNQI